MTVFFFFLFLASNSRRVVPEIKIGTDGRWGRGTRLVVEFSRDHAYMLASRLHAW